MITREWSLDLEGLRTKLNWKPLRTRRRIIKLKLVYNAIHCLHKSPLPFPRHPHNKTLFQPYVSTLSHRHSFFIDVIPQWNSLPADIVNSPSPNVFKSNFCKSPSLLFFHLTILIVITSMCLYVFVGGPWYIIANG